MNYSSKTAIRLLCAFFGVLSWATAASAAKTNEKLPPAASRKVDFIADVQPILSRHCYRCHGPDKEESNLRWDSKASVLRAGSKIIVIGKSSESRVIHLVAGTDDELVMPAKGERLSTAQIGMLRAWIDQGLVWPDSVAEPKAVSKSDWWSFKPAAKPLVPAKRSGKWPRNEIDLFILSKLTEQKLAPSREADRRTLIRRLSFDLLGLPPTPEEVQAFVSDQRSDAYEKLVDRMLASPRYGERWARHWLDTVHYADTHGYDKDKPRMNAWPYRDYIIRSFNNDDPYSHFVQQQLAGDVLFPDDPDGVVALGFIAAGPWDYVGHVELPIEKTDGLIARYNDRDDMIMTTMSTFQSLTVHCARCHNHKFDAISQKDYYSLQAVFAGVDRADRDVDLDRVVFRQRRELETKRRSIENRYSALSNKIAAASNDQLRSIDAQISRLRSLADVKSPGNGYHSGSEKTQDYTKWVQVDLGKSLAIDEVRLVPARPVDFPDTPGFGFPLRFKIEISEDETFRNNTTVIDQTTSDFAKPGDKPVTFSLGQKQGRYVRITATKLWERTSDFIFAMAELQVLVHGTNAVLGVDVSALDSIEAGLWSKQGLVDGFDSRKKLPTIGGAAIDEAELQKLVEKRGQIFESLIDEATRTDLRQTTNELAEVVDAIKKLPPSQKVYAAATDFPQNGSFIPARVPRPVHLLARGDVKRPGELMSASAIDAIPVSNDAFRIDADAPEAMRRAALAKWITDPSNLLTRRSIVNRVWQYHFGRGIVETPNDFGHMGALPTHPELLDWLAFWFMENGESIKKLHRLIVTSATYRQSSDSVDAFAKVDADNRYLWRMNRSRLDAESIRDAMLFVGGKLDASMGGPSVQQFLFKDDHSPVYDYGKFDVNSAAANRRSIYRFIVRSVPDPLMDSLDCPDASILTPKRNVTMTALQALSVLNDPFVLKQCESLAERVKGNSLSKQISEVYALTLNRHPTSTEMKELLPFAEKYGMTSVCRLVFNMSEFMFVD